VGSDSSIAYGRYVGARTGLVEAQNKIIRTFFFKNISFLNSNKNLKIQKLNKKLKNTKQKNKNLV